MSEGSTIKFWVNSFQFPCLHGSDRLVRPQWRPTVFSSSSSKVKSSAARELYQLFGKDLDFPNFWRSKTVFRCLDSREGSLFCFLFVKIFGGLAFVSKKFMQLGTSVRWRVASICIYISSAILGWWRWWWCNIDVFAAAWRAAIVGVGVLGHHVNVRDGGMVGFLLHVEVRELKRRKEKLQAEMGKQNSKQILH